jgi:hypothetical protein
MQDDKWPRNYLEEGRVVLFARILCCYGKSTFYNQHRNYLVGFWKYAFEQPICKKLNFFQAFLHSKLNLFLKIMMLIANEVSS